MKRPARSLVATLGRLGLVAAGGLALAASTEAGERAGDGSCPYGETCSDATPDGLLFEGAPLGWFPQLTTHVTAVGGRQTFRISTPPGAAFDLPFVAATTGALQVVGSGPDRVTVAATVAGTGYLRILDPDGRLYDRVELTTAEVRRARLTPSYRAAYPMADPGGWAALTTGRAELSVVLGGADETQVVDEGMTIRATSPSTRVAWDTVQVEIPAAGAPELTIDAGRLLGTRLVVPTVDHLDELVASGPTESGVGGDVTLCFPAWRRETAPGRGDKLLVIGAARTFRVTGPAHAVAAQPHDACLVVHTDGPGEVVVSATAGGRTAARAVTVRGAARPLGDLGAVLTGASEGERAASAADAALEPR